MQVDQLCARDVAALLPTASVREIAHLMRDRNVGTVVVIDAARHPVGIVTDRDLVLRAFGNGHDLSSLTAREVMTGSPRTLHGIAPVSEALAALKALGVRRMPVVGERGELVGILSLDDLLRQIAAELNSLSEAVAPSRGPVGLPAPRTAARAAAKSVGASAAGKARRGAPIERAAGDAEC